MPQPRIHADDAARKRAYKERKRRQETSPDASPSVVESSPPAGDASRGHAEPSLAGLRDLAYSEMTKILADPNAPQHIKVQAAGRVKDLVDRDSAALTPELAQLIEWRRVLETLPPEDRLAFLHERTPPAEGSVGYVRALWREARPSEPFPEWLVAMRR